MRFTSKIYLLATLILTSVGFAPPTLAVTKEAGLYTAKIEIASITAEDRAYALPQAFKQVLIKVTGYTNIDTVTGIKTKLANTKNFLQSYSYSSEFTPDQNKQLYLNVNFSEKAIQEMLSELNLSAWNEERPTLLVVAVAPNDDGKPKLLGALTTDTITKSFYREAQNLGLPMVFPTLDHQDLKQITTANIYNNNLNALKLAAQRYHADLLLIGAINLLPKTTPPNAFYQSNWQLIINGKNTTFQVNDANLNTIVQKVLAQVFAATTSTFALNTTAQQTVILHVTNVTDLTEHAAVIKYLRNLTGINKAELTDIDPEGITLQLVVMHDLATLEKELVTSGKFAAVDANGPTLTNHGSVEASEPPSATNTTYTAIPITTNDNQTDDSPATANTPITLNYKWLVNHPQL